MRRFKIEIALSVVGVMAMPFQSAIAKDVPSVSDGQSPLKIAILDMNHLIENSKASIALRNKIEEDRVKIQEHVKALEDELRTKEKELIDGQTTIAPEVMQLRKSSLEKEFEQVQEVVSVEKMQLSKNLENGMLRIQSAISKIVDQIAKEQGITLILPKSMIIHNTNALDITPEVLQKLNEAVPGTFIILSETAKEPVE